MNIRTNGGKSANARYTSLQESHDLQRRRGPRRRPSSPVFLKCCIKLLVGLLAALVLVYLGVLCAFLGSKKDLWQDVGESLIIEGRKSSGFNKSFSANKTHINDGRPTIAIATTITGCGSDPFQPFIDGAAVLKYSLDVHSRNVDSKFKYQTYVLYHPSAKECVSPLENLGYILLERPTPIEVEEIGGDGGLRERIVVNGCCGEKELIKLEAYRLTQHPLVVHLDLDVLINKPMDDVLDFMMNPALYKSNPELLAKIPIMWPEKEIPDNISLLYTKDYNVVAPKRADKPYQGGFFVIKPSLETYNEFLNILREGDYDIKRGWGKKVGPFHGGMTIQGLLPWYYQWLHPGRSVELNRCKYNNMSDKPYLQRDNGMKICRTNEKECEDCRFTSVDDVVTFHFTICQKPWSCLEYKHKRMEFQLCRKMNRKWYILRSELEASWGRSGNGTGAFKIEQYNGHCNKNGMQGYQPIQKPYGMPG